MKFLFALFCFALLSFSFGEELIYMGSKYEPVDSQRSNLYGGPLKLDTTYNLTSLDLHYQWILVSQEPRKVLEMPYAELAHIFYMKISHDISENAQRQWKYASEVSNSLGISYSHLCEVSWKLIEFTATGILAMGTFLAYFSTLTFIAIVTSLLTKHTFAFIFLVSWMYSVTYLYNFLKSRFGISLKFLILFPRLFLKSIAIVISKALISSSGKDFKEEYEMAVKGFITHDFIQEPPKKSILEMVFDDNSHGGYAVCARMADGKDYLLTVAHNVIDPRTGKKYDRKIKIRSTYTGHAIDLGLFTRIHINQETDFAMFEGPQNWESILGCKGARYLTASSLRLGEVSIYHLKGEPARWNRSGGKTVEALENYKVKVLSHTTEGYSGSPYWSGKDIVGLHSAARENANCNVMATIPDVSGLTTSNYVFETTALRGKVFDDVPKVTPEYFYSYKRTAEKLKGKMTWADEVDELEKNSSNDRFECKQYQQLETCFSGLYDDGTKSFIEWCNEVKDRRNGTLPPFNNELDNELAFQWRNSDIDLALARHENLRLKEALEKAKLEKEEPNRVDHNKYETAIPLNRRARHRPHNNRRRIPLWCGETNKWSDGQWRAHCTNPLCTVISGGRSVWCKYESHWLPYDQRYTGPDPTRNCCEDRPIERPEFKIGGDSQQAAEPQTKRARQAWREEQAQGLRKFFSSQYFWDEICSATSEAPGFRRVGKTPTFYRPKGKVDSQWSTNLINQHPELKEMVAGFGWPQFGASAELRSLVLQSSRWVARLSAARIPQPHERESVIKRTVEAYRTCKTQCPPFAKTDVLEWTSFQQSFQEAVASLELDAGVGLPFIAYGKPTHRSWVEDPALLPILAQLTFDRLQKMSEVNVDDMQPEDLIKFGLCDPIRVFVKGEPHKESKLIEGRYRLIMSVSLLDQLVARVLFQEQNKREIILWRSNPSKPGFGLSSDEQTIEFMTLLAQTVGQDVSEVISHWKKYLYPTDCSGFDWSVSDWMLADDMEVRNRLTINPTPLLIKLRSVWLHCISNSVLALSDGTLLAQTIPGVQKSGSYNTSSSNSRIRVMAAYHCGASWAMAMGDDALESNDSNLERYSVLGFKVEVSKELEFCSHIFKDIDPAIPVNQGKMLYKLIHGYNPECGNEEVRSNYINAVDSVLNELRHDPPLVDKLKQWLFPAGPQNIDN
ncbi:RNA-dependent RNA polymerase [Hemisteptia virus A]|nr:RNA-dependent RNA polymerase [Hemisteptia virus A]